MVRILITFFVCYCLINFSVSAAVLNINPVHLHLSAKQPIAVLTINNPTAQTLYFQAMPKLWRQRQGHNIYYATNKLIVSPVVLRLPANATRIIRVGLVAGLHSSTIEQAYRLYLQQLPIEQERKHNQLHLLFRIGVPVFVRPATLSAYPKLFWSMRRQHDKALVILNNVGNVHAQVNKVEIVWPSRKHIFRPQPQAFDLLPGASQRWTLRLQKGVKIPNVIVRLNGSDQAIHYEI